MYAIYMGIIFVTMYHIYVSNLKGEIQTVKPDELFKFTIGSYLQS